MLIPRSAGSLGRPADHVTGPFLTGTVRPDAPVGVAETIALARALGEVVASSSVSEFARLAGVDRTTVHDVLAGRTFLDVVTLARFERAARRRLWDGPATAD